MPRKHSKKKTDFNKYLPWIIVGALVLVFLVMGADPTGKFFAQQYSVQECREACNDYYGTSISEDVGSASAGDMSPAGGGAPPTGEPQAFEYAGACQLLCNQASDNDGDGYAFVSNKAIETTAGEFQLNPTQLAFPDLDCDDTQALMNPGQQEVQCNELDDDCDGDIDENNPPYGCNAIEGKICTDSDGGSDPYTKGSIVYEKYDVNTGSLLATSYPSDMCLTYYNSVGQEVDGLREYYCDSVNDVQYENYECSCSNGVCIDGDSDGHNSLVDCDDTNANIWQLKNMYPNVDNDNSWSNTRTSVCVGDRETTWCGDPGMSSCPDVYWPGNPDRSEPQYLDYSQDLPTRWTDCDDDDSSIGPC